LGSDPKYLLVLLRFSAAIKVYSSVIAFLFFSRIPFILNLQREATSVFTTTHDIHNLIGSYR
jgi:hypothetical protein